MDGEGQCFNVSIQNPPSLFLDMLFQQAPVDVRLLQIDPPDVEVSVSLLPKDARVADRADYLDLDHEWVRSLGPVGDSSIRCGMPNIEPGGRTTIWM